MKMTRGLQQHLPSWRNPSREGPERVSLGLVGCGYRFSVHPWGLPPNVLQMLTL